MEFHYITFDLWVGGTLEWNPNIRYVGGCRKMISNVNLDQISFNDILNIYKEVDGKAANIEVYYCLPGHELDNGISLLKGDCDLQKIVTVYRGLPIIPMYFVDNLSSLWTFDNEGNILCDELANDGDRGFQLIEHENDEIRDSELIEHENHGVRDSQLFEHENDGVSDDSTHSSCAS